MIKIVIGLLLGLVFGSVAAWGKWWLTAAGMKKPEGGGGKTSVLWVLGINGMRMLVNIAAFASVFILRNVLPFPFEAVTVGTAMGLTGEIWLHAARHFGKGKSR